jgi:D-xylulose 5-phosphate/D-fructose 6-phosphate phosphoketolase
VLEVTNRAWVADTYPYDDHLAPDGRVMEMLSEHQCQGWLEGYLLTGRHGFFSCYEAFIHIIDSMFNQHAKWLKVSQEIPWRRPIASLNYLLSSHVWRQDHNGFSHQDPGFIDSVVNKKADIIRVYLPPDANTLLSVTDHCLPSRDYVNVSSHQPDREPPGRPQHGPRPGAGHGPAGEGGVDGAGGSAVLAALRRHLHRGRAAGWDASGDDRGRRGGACGSYRRRDRRADEPRDSAADRPRAGHPPHDCGRGGQPVPGTLDQALAPAGRGETFARHEHPVSDALDGDHPAPALGRGLGGSPAAKAAQAAGAVRPDDGGAGRRVWGADRGRHEPRGARGSHGGPDRPGGGNGNSGTRTPLRPGCLPARIKYRGPPCGDGRAERTGLERSRPRRVHAHDPQAVAAPARHPRQAGGPLHDGAGESLVRGRCER